MMSYYLSLCAWVLAWPVLADNGATGGIVIHDAYARAASPSAKAGAIFMHIMNHGTQDDRLISASSEAAARVELHQHIEEDGILKMRQDPDGFDVPAGGMAELARGGNHVMLMGLTEGMDHGAQITVTLTFEHAGDLTLDVPVDLRRKGDPSGHSHSHAH